MANDRNLATRAAGSSAAARQGQSPRELISQMAPEFQRAMPRGAEAAQLVRDALTVLKNTPGLATVNPQSLLGSLMTCAQLGLRPGVGALGHAYIIPFKGQAQFILGYQGMIELANRSGEIANISARIVYANDTFRISYGLEDTLVHEPVVDGVRGDVRGYYAVFKRTNGGYGFIYMTKAEVEEHRDKFALSKNGPWKNHFDAMALKTVVRKLFTWMPRSTQIDQAIIADNTVRTNASPDADLNEVSELPEGVVEGQLVDDEDSYRGYDPESGAEIDPEGEVPQ
ncbi:RecT-like DNA pairing protein [Arthrobacter phage Bumble]|uniref:RecT-like DNA pairing protein n=1 Tax=Arthrobacter phage Bumble TaxID=2743904 RepID=A0A7G3VAC0_9CAUD|nr:RecT-like DNA pairing protein [Arthrobacter phage Bumble]